MCFIDKKFISKLYFILNLWLDKNFVSKRWDNSFVPLQYIINYKIFNNVYYENENKIDPLIIYIIYKNKLNLFINFIRSTEQISG